MRGKFGLSSGIQECYFERPILVQISFADATCRQSLAECDSHLRNWRVSHVHNSVFSSGFGDDVLSPSWGWQGISPNPSASLICFLSCEHSPAPLIFWMMRFPNGQARHCSRATLDQECNFEYPILSQIYSAALSGVIQL